MAEGRPFDVESFAKALLAKLQPTALFAERLRVDAEGLTVGGHHLPLDQIAEVHLLGLGKAAAAQVAALRAQLAPALGGRLQRPFVVTKEGHGKVGHCDLIEAAHPLPDRRSAQAAVALCRRAAACAPDDLLILCLSGGGSALAVQPRPPFSFEDKLRANAALLDGGASIVETNLIRREMSAFKNGGLLQACTARRLLTLVTSDVPIPDLRVVASGPTTFAELDRDDLRDIAEHFLEPALRDKLLAQLDDPAREAWLQARRDAVACHDAELATIADYRLLSEHCRALLTESRVKGVEVWTEPLDMPIDEGIALHLRAIAQHGADGPPFMLVSGGELPVRVSGDGQGGRDSEFVLRMAQALFVDGALGWSETELARLQIAAIATDGSDGPTDCAGGWLGLADVRRAKTEGLDLADHLRRSDSLGYLRAIDRALQTGPTGTNLMDLRLIHRG